MLTLAADHIINNQAAFARAVEEALALAAQGRLVTFGIKPDRPETGYGYIRADGNRVLEFVEKPDLETARKYLDSGDYYWNSGLFCFTAGLILAELEKHAPELLTSVKACLAASSFGSIDSFDQGVVELDAAAFQDVPSISIDYAVMEKSDHLAVVPCDIGWNDIGSWGALCGLNACDTNGNRVASEGRIMLHDVENCDIRSHDRLVAALGVEDLLIIDTPDALLVAAKDRAQDVKLLYNNLKDADHETYRHHRTVFRPWGSYTVLESGPRFKIKRLEVKPGSSISMQRHYHRSEHWIVVSGMAEVVCDDETFMVGVDESTYIKAGRKHRVSNRGLIDLVMIEVQSGDYLGEDDIVRLQDEYGRFNP